MGTPRGTCKLERDAQAMSYNHSWRSLTAGLLVLALPSVVGIQAAAHARDGQDRTPAWTDHTSNQHWVHDHEICLQLQRLSQVPSAPVLNIQITPPTLARSNLTPSFACAHQVPVHETRPRAPPVLS